MKKIALLILTILIPTSALFPYTNSVILVFFNDTHGKILPFKDSSSKLIGGISKRATLLNEIRKTNKYTFVFDAGDLLTGSIYSSAFYGELDILLMNEIGYNALGIGNHELDFGLNNLIKLKNLAKFPFLSVNLKHTNGEFIGLPLITTNIQDLKVAILGITISDISVYNPEFVKEVIIEPEIYSITNFIIENKIRETNDLVILVSHTYLSTNYIIANSGLFDIIITGHDHSLLSTNIKNCLVSQAWQWGAYAGIIKIDIDFVNKNIIQKTNYFIQINENFTNNLKIDSIIAEYDKEISNKFNKILAKSELFLDASQIRTQYSPLGNLIADMVAKYSQTEIAIINAGSIRSSIQKGNISIKDIYEIYPFDNNIVTLKLKGKTLKKIMEKGLKNRGKGAFLYYSSPVEIIITKNKTNYLYGGVNIFDEMLYSVSVSDFLFNGGDGYNEFKEEGITPVNTFTPIRDVIMYRISSLGIINNQNLDLTQRIRVERR